MSDDNNINGYPAGAYSRVLIITKPTPDELTTTVRNQVIAFCDENDIPWTDDDTIFNTEKLLIVAIGGDGTMLTGMRQALDQKDSIVCGFNTGTLGFLADTYTGSVYRTLANVSRKFGIIEKRMVLQGSVYIDGVEKFNPRMIVAANELILSSMTNQYPIKVEVSINDKMVSENVGSGVLVATSTGSTAQALSAGGAIVSPSTNIMQVVPLMAHTLTSRPVITSGRDTVTLRADLTKSRQPIEVFGDGICLASSEHHFGASEIELRIKKHPMTVNVYRPENWDFFNVLREKLKW